ncbi:DUF3570 domain-containing protein [Marinobacter segnicrescens]|uniref:DUF3570 domain-containing protein n=1 Tax=Marinobacter segnicrescens TaxID=430453 RepID=UPI003A8D5563
MAVTDRHCATAVLGWLLILASGVQGATLPEDKVDAFYHRYEGGGMTIDGPSVLVRKGVGNQVSFSGQYYVDSVSAASVDVLATASPYTEERTEYTVGANYLEGNSILSVSYTNSSENDYEANTLFLGITQEFFGNMTTLSIGYARGWDTVMAVGNDTFEEEADRQNYQLGLTQVLTPNSLVGLDFEVITDEGFLENPYRQNRYIDPSDPTNYLYQPERYPDTRTSISAALRGRYYFPWRASLRGSYRYFTDDWGIDAHTIDLGYVHSLGPNWTLEGGVRYYTQDQADFYSDLYDYGNSQTHLARDKEMSTFSGLTFSAGVEYQWDQVAIPGVDRLQLGLLVDYLDFEYDNFRDVTASGGYLPGEEPLYGFDSWVTRASILFEY